MAATVPVALLGFSSFERNALAASFRLEPDRQPRYVHVLDIDDARFVVADADQPGVPELLDTLGRTGDSVFIGGQAPANVAAWMMRPIDAAQVLRELDNLLAVRERPASGQPASGPMSLSSGPGSLASGPLPLSTGLTLRARAAGDRPAEHAAHARRAIDDEPRAPTAEQRQAESAARRQRREAALQPVTLRNALLVDDSEVALAFLERQLHRHGIAADWAMNSTKALELLSQRDYGMVFLDIDLGEHSELDGLALCQRIKRRMPAANGKAPLVVLVTASNDPTDRVRGTLAGADGHIGKPLDVAALDRLLQSHGLGPVGDPAGPRSR